MKVILILEFQVEFLISKYNIFHKEDRAFREFFSVSSLNAL